MQISPKRRKRREASGSLLPTHVGLFWALLYLSSDWFINGRQGELKHSTMEMRFANLQRAWKILVSFCFSAVQTKPFDNIISQLGIAKPPAAVINKHWSCWSLCAKPALSKRQLPPRLTCYLLLCNLIWLQLARSSICLRRLWDVYELIRVYHRNGLSFGDNNNFKGTIWSH